MYHQTEDGNAEFFAEHYKNKLRYDHAQKRWLIWGGHWWQPDINGEIMRCAKGVLKQRRLLAESMDLDQRAKEIKFTLASEKRSQLESMISLARSKQQVADTGLGWDAMPHLLGVSNGVVDLRTGKITKGVQEHKITMHVDLPYEPEAKSDLWTQVISDILGPIDMINYFQTAVGYSASGEIREQCLFMLYGDGANGKSTLVDTIQKALGVYAYTMPFSTIEFASRSAVSNDVAALAGRRFIVASETQENIRLNEGRIKSLTGDQTITARKLYADYFTYKPQGKYWLCFNHKPRSTDDTLGFWRRIRLISLGPPIPPEKQDQHLTAKLLKELPAILTWVVQGARAWYEHGLVTPQWITEETARYRLEQDSLKEFFDDCIELETDAKCRNSDIWAVYLKWARLNDDKWHVGRKTFSQKLEARGFRQIKWGEAQERFWVGLRLRDFIESDTSDTSRQVN